MSSSRTNLLAFVLFSCVASLIFYVEDKEDPSQKEANLYPALLDSHPNIETEKSAIANKPKAKVDLRVSPSPVSSMRFEKFDVDKIRKIESYLSSTQRLNEFRRSGLDTEENLGTALRIIEDAKWTKNPNRENISQRVVSLKFIQLSSYLSFRDCIRLVEQLSEALVSFPKKHHSRTIIGLDLYSIGKNCTRKFPQDTQSMVDTAIGEKAKLQIMSAIKTVLARDSI